MHGHTGTDTLSLFSHSRDWLHVLCLFVVYLVAPVKTGFWLLLCLNSERISGGPLHLRDGSASSTTPPLPPAPGKPLAQGQNQETSFSCSLAG